MTIVESGKRKVERVKNLRALCVSAVSALLLLTFVAVPVAAQAQARSKTYAITGAKIHTLAGPAIENGTVVIRDGKILDVGARVSVPSGATVINGRGLEVYRWIRASWKIFRRNLWRPARCIRRASTFLWRGRQA
jgi:hypothetical protein